MTSGEDLINFSCGVLWPGAVAMKKNRLEFLPEDVFCVISFKRDHLTSGKSMLAVPWLGLMGRPHEIVTHYCCVDHGSECSEKSDALLVDFVCIKFNAFSGVKRRKFFLKISRELCVVNSCTKSHE